MNYLILRYFETKTIFPQDRIFEKLLILINMGEMYICDWMYLSITFQILEREITT